MEDVREKMVGCCVICWEAASAVAAADGEVAISCDAGGITVVA